MMLTVEATETATRPIQVDMDLVGISMGLLMILGCLVIWEGIKWLVMEVGREYLPGASARKLRRLKRLRDATTQAIERELERISDEGGRPSTTRSANERRQMVSEGAGNTSMETTRATTPTTMPESQLPQPSTSFSVRARTPPGVLRSPTRSSPGSAREDDDREEVQRVCYDVVSLMRCEEIREALRLHGLQTSGLKGDQCTRLSNVMVANYGNSRSPTVRQYRYLLWLWRHRSLQGRVLLSWNAMRDRETTSRTIHTWNQL